MINSMTGFGCATGRLDDADYLVEIRAVNNRYFKTNVKLPEELAFLETDIEELLRASLHRGTINYVLRLKNQSAGVICQIDEQLLHKYVEKLAGLAPHSTVSYHIDVASLLSLPGVIQTPAGDEQQAQRTKHEVLAATSRALEQLKQMRAAEGTALLADMQTSCQVVEQNIRKINTRRQLVVKEYQQKLTKRVNELLADAAISLDAEMLARELAVYADRCDISEEIARLDSHLQQFRQSCHETDQPGRKLDFITQEMLREANTIASKAADAQIAQLVIEIKCSIDRLKEQVQNIE